VLVFLPPKDFTFRLPQTKSGPLAPLNEEFEDRDASCDRFNIFRVLQHWTGASIKDELAIY